MLAVTKIAWSPGPATGRFSSLVASSKAKRAMCTAGNVGGTGIRQVHRRRVTVWGDHAGLYNQ